MSVAYNYPSVTVSGAYTTGTNFFVESPGYNPIPAVPQTGGSVNVTVKAVQVKAGYLGQVLHLTVSGPNQIVWESKPKKTHDKALKAANKAKDAAVARLFEEN